MTTQKTINVYEYEDLETEQLQNGVERMRVISTTDNEGWRYSRRRVQFLDKDEKVIIEADFFYDELNDLLIK